jgi:uncharacterized protein
VPWPTQPKQPKSLHSRGCAGNLGRPEIVGEVMELTCPKCQGAMRSYERNGVTVDQCSECRGIFLDRGELERLVDAENAWHGGQGAQAAGQPQPSYGQPAYREETYGGSGGGYGKHPKKRRKSFMDELFD